MDLIIFRNISKCVNYGVYIFKIFGSVTSTKNLKKLKLT